MKKTSILYPFVAIALCAFTFGCQSEKTSESVIDLEATAREPKPFTQSDLPGTVSFIPLETTDSSLIGMGANIQVSANRILVSSTNQPLLVFDKKTGRYLNQIGQKGEGPEGYANDGFGNLFYWLDQQQEVVYLLGINGHSLLRYDLSGRFLGKTTLPEGTPESPNLYSSYLFISNDTIIAHNKYISEDSIPSLICFSGTNGTVYWTVPAQTPLLPSFSEIEESYYLYGGFLPYGGNLSTFNFRDRKTYSFSTEAPTVWQNEGQTYFKEAFRDTIFRIQPDGTLTFHQELHLGARSWPFDRRTDADMPADWITIDYILESPRLLYIHWHTGFYQPADRRKSFCTLYDKQTGTLRTNKGEQINDEAQNLPPIAFQKKSTRGEWVGLLNAPDIVEWKAKHPQAQYPESLSNIGEEDNPVVVLLGI